MLVPLKDFYREVTGSINKTWNTGTAVNAATRWNVPLVNVGKASRSFFRVDTSHVEEARAKYKLERVEANHRPTRTMELHAPEYAIVIERLGVVEGKLDSIIHALKIHFETGANVK